MRALFLSITLFDEVKPIVTEMLLLLGSGDPKISFFDDDILLAPWGLVSFAVIERTFPVD